MKYPTLMEISYKTETYVLNLIVSSTTEDEQIHFYFVAVLFYNLYIYISLIIYNNKYIILWHQILWSHLCCSKDEVNLVTLSFCRFTRFNVLVFIVTVIIMCRLRNSDQVLTTWVHIQIPNEI